MYILDKLNRNIVENIGYKQLCYYDLKHTAIDEFIGNFTRAQKRMNLNPSFRLLKKSRNTILCTTAFLFKPLL